MHCSTWLEGAVFTVCVSRSLLQILCLCSIPLQFESLYKELHGVHGYSNLSIIGTVLLVPTVLGLAAICGIDAFTTRRSSAGNRDARGRQNRPHAQWFWGTDWTQYVWLCLVWTYSIVYTLTRSDDLIHWTASMMVITLYEYSKYYVLDLDLLARNSWDVSIISNASSLYLFCTCHQRTCAITWPFEPTGILIIAYVIGMITHLSKTTRQPAQPLMNRWRGQNLSMLGF